MDNESLAAADSHCLRAVANALIVDRGLIAFLRARTTPNPLQPQQASTLVTDGIYRCTRNPMYLGMALALLGWAGWLAHPLALACIPLAMAWLQRFQIQPEERILEQRFGEAFRRYRQRVRRWL